MQSQNENLFPVDIFIEKYLSDEDIVSVCAEQFSLSKEDIYISADITVEISNKIQLFCEKEAIEGDFKILLSVCPQNDLLKEVIGKIGDEIAIAKKFADSFHCKCMVGDNSNFEDYEEDRYFLVQDTSDDVEEIYIDSAEIEDGIYIIQN